MEDKKDVLRTIYYRIGHVNDALNYLESKDDDCTEIPYCITYFIRKEINEIEQILSESI